MSDPASPDGFATDDDLSGLSGLSGPAPGGAFPGDDGIGVRFPPGLGIIPPRELARVPRPRRGGELAA